jgi:hypothetical protein
MDILGLGAVAVDDLLFLREFPRPDSKIPIIRQERRAGARPLHSTILVDTVTKTRTILFDERDLGAPLAELLALVDHLVLPCDFARKISGVGGGSPRGAPDTPAIARALWRL